MSRQVILKSADSGQVLSEIDEQSLGEFLIGRDAEANDLFLNDRGVSRRHARIFRDGSRLLLEDVGSSGGSYLNNREIRRPHALTNGVELRIGGVKMLVQINGVDDAAAAEEDGATQVEPDRTISGPADHPGHSAAGGATVAAFGSKGQTPPAPASDLAPDFAIDLSDELLTIGRDASCDVHLDSPIVSRVHARIKPLGHGWAIRDEGSHNGTFVNGEPAEDWRKLLDGDVVTIGPHRLHFDGTRLARERLRNGARIEVVSLIKEVTDRQTGKPRRLLDKVSLAIKPGEFIGLMGPVGCGKSTLMGMVNGRELAEAGMVFYDGEDLFANIDALKADISYIPQQIDPQQVIVHQDLPVAEALRFTSRLRLPPDTSEQELEENIARVLEVVRLTKRRDVQIKHLSGGQRKKVAVAMELLSKPRVLLADEVTAGMDLGNEQQTMELFRKLADEGMTVVTITHYVDRLKMCDAVACFSGGKLVFYGPPEKLPPHFGAEDMGDVYPVLEANEPEKLALEYQKTPFYQKYVSSRLGSQRRQGSTRRPPVFSRGDRIRQWRTLVSRYLRLISLDPSSVCVLLAVAPLVAWMLCILAWSVDAPSLPDAAERKVAIQQGLFCFGSVITVLFLGLFGAVREIVKELPIYRHERFVNLLMGPYLLSKVTALSLLSGAEALLVAFILWQWGPLEAHPFGMVFLLLWLVGICGTMMGLLISAAVSSSDQAVMVMIAVVIPQILFSGALVPIKGTSAIIAKSSILGYWALNALKAMLSPRTQQFIDSTVSADGARLLPPLLALGAHLAVYTALAMFFLARKDGPGGVIKAIVSLRDIAKSGSATTQASVRGK